MKITEVITDENHPIYLHCATGGRATLAAQQLVKLEGRIDGNQHPIR